MKNSGRPLYNETWHIQTPGHSKSFQSLVFVLTQLNFGRCPSPRVYIYTSSLIQTMPRLSFLDHFCPFPHWFQPYAGGSRDRHWRETILKIGQSGHRLSLRLSMGWTLQVMGSWLWPIEQSSILSTRFDCPVARQNSALLATARLWN